MKHLEDLAVDALATYRLTRLVVEDRIPLGKLRERVQDRWPNSLLAEWMSCPWCAGLWVSAVVVTARAVAPRCWTHPATALALSAVTGLLSTWETRD